MAQGSNELASTSTSTKASASHGVTVKTPPPINGITYSPIQNFSSNEGSSSENTRGETRSTQSIGVSVPENEVNEVSVVGVSESTRTSINIGTEHIVPLESVNELSVVGEQSSGSSVITNENLATEEAVDNNNVPLEANINTEIETIQSQTVVLREEVLIVTAIPVPSESIIKIEIARSIVYGGLTELIASLGIVTSAATTTTTTGKIVAFSLASLITGLFVMTYKISELWMNKDETRQDEQEAREVESYENVFGDRRNYRLHFTVATLSFVLFGLVPPLVYGFTFRKPEDKLLKISTVTIVTVFCTALLGVGKAYIKGPSTCVEYINIIGKCVVDAIGTSVLTTLGGDLIENYIQQTGWFEPNKMPTLFQPGLSFENGTWGAF